MKLLGMVVCKETALKVTMENCTTINIAQGFNNGDQVCWVQGVEFCFNLV
jgi:hypothetical protein